MKMNSGQKNKADAARCAFYPGNPNRKEADGISKNGSEYNVGTTAKDYIYHQTSIERISIMKTWNIPLQRINCDQAIQPRAALDDEYTEELAKELKDGKMFPPVVIFHDLYDYWIADGFHRFAAHQKAGHCEIIADVRKGGEREAILHSVSANAAHGKRRSNADKRKVVLNLLKDKEWSRWTDRFIAEKCRVSQPFVSAIRKELTDNGYKFSENRTTTNGRKMNVAQIGSKRGRTHHLTLAPAKSAPSSDEHAALPHGSETPSPLVNNDIQILVAKVAELQATLREKDRIIENLEAKMWTIENENAYSETIAETAYA